MPYFPVDSSRDAGQRRDYHRGMPDREYARLIARGEGHTWTAAEVAALRIRIERASGHRRSS